MRAISAIASASNQALRTTEAALASRHRLGTGLGLSIAKRLVELHGGTVVTVELPMAPGAAHAIER